MLKQLRDRVSISRVFLETDLNEIPRLVRNGHRLSELYLIFDLNKPTFTIFTKSFSVPMDTDTPYINLIIIIFAFE